LSSLPIIIEIGRLDLGYLIDSPLPKLASDLSSYLLYTSHLVHLASSISITFLSLRFDTPGRHFVSVPSVQRFFPVWEAGFVFSSEPGGRHVIEQYTSRSVSFSGHKTGSIFRISKLIEAASMATGTGWEK